MEKIHQLGDKIADRYRIVGFLGQGNTGITSPITLDRNKPFKTKVIFQRTDRILRIKNPTAGFNLTNR